MRGQVVGLGLWVVGRGLWKEKEKEGCPCQSNRFVRSGLFQEFPVVDKKKKVKLI